MFSLQNIINKKFENLLHIFTFTFQNILLRDIHVVFFVNEWHEFYVYVLGMCMVSSMRDI